ncbi:MAG: hypothetical protein K0S47_2554 [Herbinix sp.]|jgi:hypothetical protein|nr:hypothetical protein [Herbinix sp.]
MISLHILEVKAFMAKLFTNTMFDHFILKEMDVQTFTNFHISGQFNETFFSKDELMERGEKQNTRWSDVKAIAFAMIKGNKTPLQLRIVFQLPVEDISVMLQAGTGKLRVEEIGGLYLNVRFDKGELNVITGTAIKTFTMDKTLEQEWDLAVRNFLKQQGIPFEE